MALKIGQVAKMFGINEETLRYYEKEGFLFPEKNPENGYRDYSFRDILILTDVLFYRSIGIPIKDIHSIFDGMSPEEVTSLIVQKKSDVRNAIKGLQESLLKLSYWEEFHKESLKYMGSFSLCEMPAVLVSKRAITQNKAPGKELRKLIPWQKELSYFATFSFYCDLSLQTLSETVVSRYVVIDKSIASNLELTLNSFDYVEEKEERCLFTVVEYQENPSAMLSPLLKYAKEHGLSLAGPIYGRQSINDYSQNQPREFYRVYAVLK